MTCTICKRPLSARPYSLAIPTVVSRRKTEVLTALSFRAYDTELAKRSDAIPFCGVRCSGAGLERYLQSGNLDMPNQHGAEETK
jgi:hypothetical protein